MMTIFSSHLKSLDEVCFSFLQNKNRRIICSIENICLQNVMISDDNSTLPQHPYLEKTYSTDYPRGTISPQVTIVSCPVALK